jgi:nucleoside-triphosphatase THEP1
MNSDQTMKKTKSLSKTKREQITTDDTHLFASVIGEDLFLEEESIKTFSDWKSFVNSSPIQRPPMPTPAQWKTLTKEQKETSRDIRSKYNAAFDPILTSSRLVVRDKILRQISVNRKTRDSARFAILLRGFPTVGKTTLIKYIGKRYEVACRDLLFSISKQRDVIPHTKNRYIPVVFVSLRAQKQREKVTLFGFLNKLARFYGIPAQKNEDRLIEAIIATACACQTSLIIIDELSNLDLRFIGSKTVVDTIKDLMNHIPATFLFAGIADRVEKIFAGFDAEEIEIVETATQTTKGAKPKTVRQERIKSTSQMNHRLANYDLHPLNSENGLAGEAEDIIEVIDEEIRLIHHKPGDLKKLAPHIIARTNGFIGAIVALIRLACEAAIYDSSVSEERITKKLLDDVTLSRAAETFANRQAS